MKKKLVTIVLVFAALAVIGVFAQGQAQPASTQQPAAPAAGQQPAGQQPAGQPAQPQQKKEIKDPAEYNAYVGAVQQQDPNAKISGLEAFLQQYPNSVMKEDALELLMAAYQQTGNAQKMSDTANRLLQANPNNVRALALLAFYHRSLAQAGQDAQKNLDLAKQYGEKGLQALQTYQKPEGVSDQEYEKIKTQMGGIFSGAVGLAALQSKDYATATKDLKAAADVNPNDFSTVYPLALAYLQENPPDYLNGIWYGARAANLAPNPQMQQQIEKYVKSMYTKYHGSDEGWPNVMATAKASPTPPPDFKVTQYIPPTPAQQAHDLVTKKAPKDMSFAEWELVLSSGEQADADTVWNAIKGVSLQMEGQVLSASPTKIEIAASEDDIQAKRADIILNMTGTIPARLMPKEGSTLDFEGTPTSYTPSPFVMTMEKGALLTKAAPKPTPKKRPTATRRKKPAAQ
jgi:tetratricopeptide (TPR) repeat protein